MSQASHQPHSPSGFPLRAFAIAVLSLSICLFAAPAARADCTAPAAPAGVIIYNTDVHVPQYCDGTNWIATGRPGAGGAGCTSPSAVEGVLLYNEDHRVPQYCDGSVWRAMAPLGGGGGGGGGGGAQDWAETAAGYFHTCAIKGDGTTWCWGMDDNGQLGNGAATGNQDSPSAVDTTGVSGAGWEAISAAADHSCGIRDDGTAWCWGLDGGGQLGNGATSGTQDSPSAVDASGASGSTWTAIAAGGDAFSCGIRDDGTAWCWGSDTNGKLGNGASGSATSPSAVDASGVSGTAWTALAAGTDHSCAIRDDGTVWCWGEGGQGRLGNGGSANQTSPVQVDTASVSGAAWTGITAAAKHSCGIRDDGTAWCWGEGMWGRLGYGGTGTQTTPVQVDATGVSGTAWTEIAAGGNFSIGHSCAIRDDGSAWCWGNNSNGRLGDGTSGGSQNTPVQVDATSVSGTGWTAITTGANHNCGIRDDGTVRCWGSDSDGQLGNGAATSDRHSPAEVSGSALWQAISTGQGMLGVVCAIKSDGTAWCWGVDFSGQLGDGPALTGSQSSPSAVDVTGVSGTAWTAIAASGSHSCGVRDDGTAWCWGIDADGQLGNGASGGATSPSAVDTTGVSGTAWTAITTGYFHSCGIRDDGTAWCWGDDGAGKLGNGATTGDQPSPSAVDTTGVSGTVWTAITAASYATNQGHTCGIRDDGTAWCWGSDADGQLGNGATTGNQVSPSAVDTTGVSGTDWIAISTGGDGSNRFSCGLRDDGTAWCWGIDSFGQLGNGATAGNQTSPSAVDTTGVSGTAWRAITADLYHACGLRDDDTAWCWGRDSFGQLGNGPSTTDDQASPSAVAGSGTWNVISTGHYNTCALAGTTLPGEAFCWGDNSYGQLGIGEYNYAVTAVQTDCGLPAGAPGTLLYNSTGNFVQYCDGVGWVAIGK